MQYGAISLDLVLNLIHALPVTNFRLQVDLQVEFVSNNISVKSKSMVSKYQ